METQKLMCADGVFKALDYGKEVTIRKGRRNILLGNLIFENIDTNEQAHVWVNNVMYCRLKDVPLELLEYDGFSDVENALECMKDFYPDMTYETEVTVVKFNLKHI